MNKFLHFNVALHPNASLKQKKKFQSRTAAVEPVSAKEIRAIAGIFLNLSAGALSVNLNLGITMVSLKDRYNKKEGRDQAVKRMAPVSLDVKAVQITQSHIFIQLAEIKGITLLLRLNKATGFSTVTGNLTVGG